MSKRSNNEESLEQPPMKKAQLESVVQYTKTSTAAQKSLQTDKCNSKFKSFMCSLIDRDRWLREIGLQYQLSNLEEKRFEAMEVDDCDPQ